MWKMSIQYMARDSNPQPFEHESSPITHNVTRIVWHINKGIAHLQVDIIERR